MSMTASELLARWKDREPSPRGGLATGDGEENDRALRLLFFLRFVEDNARDYNLTFSDEEQLADIAQAYGTSFYPAEKFCLHVTDLAQRLELDAEAFDGYVRSISQTVFREVFNAFDVKPGALDLSHEPTIGRDIVEGMRTLGHADKETGHISYYWDQRLAVEILVRMLGQKREHVRICDPMCGAGGSLLMLYDERGSLMAKKLELEGMDKHAPSVAQASMRLMMNGCEGPIALRVGDSLAAHAPFARPCDGVICEPGSELYKLKANFMVDDAIFGVLPSGRSVVRDTESRAVLRAADLLSPTGVAVLTLSRTLGFASNATELRRYLVENNLIEASIELPKGFLDSRDESLFVWVLRKGRTSKSPILLLNADGDGAKPLSAPNRDASGLRRPPHDFQWIVNAVDSHDQIPFASMDVTRDQVLATPDASLRFTTYSTLVDMDTKMEGLPSLTELEKQQAELQTELEKADERFGKALNELKEAKR